MGVIYVLKPVYIHTPVCVRIKKRIEWREKSFEAIRALAM